MKQQQSGEALIKEKLDHIAAPATTGLWLQMKKKLDQQMPQQNSPAANRNCLLIGKLRETDSASAEDKDSSPKAHPTCLNNVTTLFN